MINRRYGLIGFKEHQMYYFQQSSPVLLNDTFSPKRAQRLSTVCQPVTYGKYLQQKEDRKTLIGWQNTEPSIF